MRTPAIDPTLVPRWEEAGEDLARLSAFRQGYVLERLLAILEAELAARARNAKPTPTLRVVPGRFLREP